MIVGVRLRSSIRILKDPGIDIASMIGAGKRACRSFAMQTEPRVMRDKMHLSPGLLVFLPGRIGHMGE
jgi:hypothetical protein